MGKTNSRIQRLESQLLRVKAELKDLRETAEVQGRVCIDQGNRISQVKTDIKWLKSKVFILNTCYKSLLERIYRIENQTVWGKCCNWLAKKAGC